MISNIMTTTVLNSIPISFHQQIVKKFRWKCRLRQSIGLVASLDSLVVPGISPENGKYLGVLCMFLVSVHVHSSLLRVAPWPLLPQPERQCA